LVRIDVAHEDSDNRRHQSTSPPDAAVFDAAETIDTGALLLPENIEFDAPGEVAAPSSPDDHPDAVSTETTSTAGSTDDAAPVARRLERVVSDARYAADHLEERLTLSARLLKAIRQQTVKLDESLDALVERRRAAGEAEASLEERFASVDARLDEVVRSFDRHTADVGRSTLERCEAIARIVQEAEVNVALMLARVAELVEGHGLDPRRVYVRPDAGPASARTGVAPTPASAEIGSPPADERNSCDEPNPSPTNTTSRDEDDVVDAHREDFGDCSAKEFQTNDATTQVLATVADELRTPIDTVANVVGLLSETPLDGRQRDYVRSLRASVDDLLGMLESVPGGDTIDPFATSTSRGSFQLEQCITDTVEAIRPTLESAGGSLEVAIDDEVPRFVEGDARHLRQALLYTLTHATRDARQRSWLLVISLIERVTQSLTVRFVIRDAASPQLDELEASVMSVGDAEDDSPSLVADDAAGLGLVIARQMIEALDGRLGVARIDDERRVVWFAVPLSDASKTARERRRRGSRAASGPCSTSRSTACGRDAPSRPRASSTSSSSEPMRPSRSARRSRGGGA
jgi:hypothetical protein